MNRWMRFMTIILAVSLVSGCRRDGSDNHGAKSTVTTDEEFAQSIAPYMAEGAVLSRKAPAPGVPSRFHALKDAAEKTLRIGFYPFDPKGDVRRRYSASFLKESKIKEPVLVHEFNANFIRNTMDNYYYHMVAEHPRGGAFWEITYIHGEGRFEPGTISFNSVGSDGKGEGVFLTQDEVRLYAEAKLDTVLERDPIAVHLPADYHIPETRYVWYFEVPGTPAKEYVLDPYFPMESVPGQSLPLASAAELPGPTFYAADMPTRISRLNRRLNLYELMDDRAEESRGRSTVAGLPPMILDPVEFVRF